MNHHQRLSKVLSASTIFHTKDADKIIWTTKMEKCNLKFQKQPQISVWFYRQLKDLSITRETDFKKHAPWPFQHRASRSALWQRLNHAGSSCVGIAWRNGKSLCTVLISVRRRVLKGLVWFIRTVPLKPWGYVHLKKMRTRHLISLSDSCWWKVSLSGNTRMFWTEQKKTESCWHHKCVARKNELRDAG